MTTSSCICPGTKTLIGLALAGEALPDCPAHRPSTEATGNTLALNGDNRLAATLGARLTERN